MVGLPLYILDKLDKENILSTDIIMNKIKSYDSS